MLRLECPQDGAARAGQCEIRAQPPVDRSHEPEGLVAGGCRPAQRVLAQERALHEEGAVGSCQHPRDEFMQQLFVPVDEGQLLRGRRGEAHVIAVGREVALLDDGRRGHLVVDISEKTRVILVLGLIFRRGQGGGQPDDQAFLAALPDASDQVGAHESPVVEQVVAFVEDDRANPVFHERIDCGDRVRMQHPRDLLGALPGELLANPTHAAADAAAELPRMGDGQLGEPCRGIRLGATRGHEFFFPQRTGEVLEGFRIAGHAQSLVRQGGQLRGFILRDQGRITGEIGCRSGPLPADRHRRGQHECATPFAGGQQEAEQGLSRAGRGDDVHLLVRARRQLVEDFLLVGAQGAGEVP